MELPCKYRINTKYWAAANCTGTCDPNKCPFLAQLTYLSGPMLCTATVWKVGAGEGMAGGEGAFVSFGRHQEV